MSDFMIIEIRRADVSDSVAQARSLFLNALLAKPPALNQSTDALALRCLVGGMYEFVDVEGAALDGPVLTLLWSAEEWWRIASRWSDDDDTCHAIEIVDEQIVCPKLGDARGIDAICEAYVREYTDKIIRDVTAHGSEGAAANAAYFYSTDYDRKDSASEQIAGRLAAAFGGAGIVIFGCGGHADCVEEDDGEDGEESDNEAASVDETPGGETIH